jgi:histidinol-phosphatase (PHP family)
MIDSHLHTAVTIDGKMSEAQACERAAQLGMRAITFTNHHMLTEPEYTVSLVDFMEHWRRIQVCQKLYPTLDIRLGLEVDYYEGREAEIRASVEEYERVIGRPVDLVLGAVHHLDGFFFSNKKEAPLFYKNREIGELYHDYFIMATKAAQSCLFDVMAHPDLIKKFVDTFAARLPFEQYRDVVEPYLKTLLTCGIGLEVNTKGFSLKVPEAYPAEEILKLYLSKAKELGKEPILTIGSDAHKVEDVGKCLSEGAGLLAKFGQGTVMSFEQRRPRSVKL